MLYVKNIQSWEERMLRLRKVVDNDLFKRYSITTDRYYAIRNAQERLIYWRNWGGDLGSNAMQKAEAATEQAKADYQMMLANEAAARYADYTEGYPDGPVKKTPVKNPDNWPDRPLM